MKNPQKAVFTMLVAVLLLEFGSLTKIQKVWGLAFSPPEQQSTDKKQSSDGSKQPGHDVPAVVSATEPSHPVTRQL